jgi:transposase
VLESTSDYWRIWYYLAEAAGLEVWLVNARDVKHLPGRGKSDREDCVWLCKLNERGMLRRSFVPPQAVRDLRSLTRTRSRLAQDQARHQSRVEKILEDALLKISVVISDLFGASGRLDAAIERQLASIPRTTPACTGCGLIGGGHSPGCARDGTPVPGLVQRLDEMTGVGMRNAQVFIAELGTDPSVFPTPGHAAAWARLTSRNVQSGTRDRPGPAGKGNPYLRGALGQCVMAAAKTDTRLGEQYRRLARRRGKQKAIVAVSRVICEVAWMLICDPDARFTDPGPGYYTPRSPARQTRSKIREIERLNPGMKVTLTPIDPATHAA